MKKIKVFMMATLIMALVGLTGCTDSAEFAGPQPGIELAIVYGHHANAPVPALNSSTVLLSRKKIGK